MKQLCAIVVILALSGCSGKMRGEPVFGVSAGDVKPGEPLGTTFTVSGTLTYDKVWDAAMVAMSHDMTVIESHKPTGVIKSKGGEKIVGLFITPTAPKAMEYRIETSSVRPLGLNSTNGRGWDPVVVRDFKAALAKVTPAQPPSETSAWILKQTQVNVSGLTYAIEDGQFVRRLELASPMSRGRIQQTIPIAQITRIGMLHTDKYLSYVLSCNSPCVEHLSQDMEDQPNADEKSEKFLFEIYQKYDASFPPRMNRALQTLVQEHGGKATLYEQPKPKEAF